MLFVTRQLLRGLAVSAAVAETRLLPTAALPPTAVSSPSLYSHMSGRGICTGATQEDPTVVLALGSNLGDRAANLEEGLRQLRESGAFKVSAHSRLYQSSAAYVTDQPDFLNAAILGTTSLGPLDLLDALKRIEATVGRKSGGVRYGPRPLDLDIIFYANQTITDERLQIPHPRLEERDFVLAPLADLMELSQAEMQGEVVERLSEVVRRWRASGGEGRIGCEALFPVLPLPQREGRHSSVLPLGIATHVMGILNVTPDSFSDGGYLRHVDNVLEKAADMLASGASILDIGGQSTRPGAERVSPEDEMERVLPAIRALRREFPDSVLSVDTFYSAVAKEAVIAGADIVNDVTGGAGDDQQPGRMHAVVASLPGVPYVSMHMRGDPSTMQSEANTTYDDLVAQVAAELTEGMGAAVREDVPPWRLVADPGIGFAKTHQQNFRLIRDLPRLRSLLRGIANPPLLVGPSRKGFLAMPTGGKAAADRDWATAAAITGCIAGGADIVRVHNVPVCVDAAATADHIWRARHWSQ